MDGEMEEKKQPGWKKVIVKISQTLLVCAFLIYVITLVLGLLKDLGSFISPIVRLFEPRFVYRELELLPRTNPLFGQEFLGFLESEDNSCTLWSIEHVYHPIYFSGNKLMIYNNQNLEQVAREFELPGNIVDKMFVYVGNNSEYFKQYVFLTQRDGKNYITAFWNKKFTKDGAYKYLQLKYSIGTEGKKLVPIKSYNDHFACVNEKNNTLFIYKTNGELVLKKTFQRKSAFFVFDMNIVQYDGSTLSLFSIIGNNLVQKSSIHFPKNGDVSIASMADNNFFHEKYFNDGTSTYYLDENFKLAKNHEPPSDDIFFAGIEKVFTSFFHVPANKNHEFSKLEHSFFEGSTYNIILNEIMSYKECAIIKNSIFSFLPAVANVDYEEKVYINTMKKPAFGRAKGFLSTSDGDKKTVYFYTNRGVYKYQEK
ncbi:MAG: hypothetical protein KBC24_02025 [Caldisericia bacterium]|nr:hypothetical protein [Caldisericia bacterium]